MGEEMQVVGVRFPVDQISEIEARAEQEGLTKSEFIRNAVARELGEELLSDRVDDLEEAVRFLLEETAPNQELAYVNSRHLTLLEQLDQD